MSSLVCKFNRRLEKLKERMAIYRRSKSQYQLSFLESYRRLAWLKEKQGYRVHEAFRIGLLDPKLKKEQFDRFISRKQLIEVQSKLSPVRLASLLTDRAQFTLYTDALGFPTPKVLGMLWPRYSGVDEHGKSLSQVSDWIQYFDARLTGEFVTKSCGDHYGASVCLYKRVGDEFENLASHQRFSVEGLYAELLIQGRKHGVIIQERVRNHPALIELSQNETLQTIRVVTFIDGSDNFTVLHALFRPVATDEVIDNYNNYDGGVLLARVDVDSGKIIRTHFMRDDIPGASIVDKHPATGVRFSGFQLPDWDAAMDCIREAAFKMRPMRTVGWDLALTPSGPVIIEGNAFFNTNYLYGDSKTRLFDELARQGHSIRYPDNCPPWLAK